MVNAVVHSSGVITPHKVQRKNAASNPSQQNAKTKPKTGKKTAGKGHVDINV